MECYTTHLEGGAEIFLNLWHFIAPALDLMPCLQAQGTRDYKEGINTIR